MLELDDRRWSELRHAYGPAGDIPGLLRQLESFPVARGDDEPWFSLWGSLCHQGDAYSASFAAVPHIVRVLATDPLRADPSFFQLPACIEIARARHSTPVPPDLQGAYSAALAALPALVGSAASREWDSSFLCCALSAVAAATGHPGVAEAVLELQPDVAEQFLKWFHEQ